MDGPYITSRNVCIWLLCKGPSQFSQTSESAYDIKKIVLTKNIRTGNKSTYISTDS